jgi:hypothetical protein
MGMNEGYFRKRRSRAPACLLVPGGQVKRKRLRSFLVFFKMMCPYIKMGLESTNMALFQV